MRTAIAFAVASGLLLSACGAETPEQRPTNVALRRNVSRSELVEFVVSEPARAARVRGLYLEIEQLMLELDHDRRAALGHLPGATELPTEDETRRIVSEFAARERRVMERYVEIQMRLRAELNEAEFARLDRIQ